MPKELRSIEDITPDAKNANLGTERGRFLLEKSFRELGAGRSVVTDAEGRMIGGNKALEIAEELGLPIEVIQTDGSMLVVVQRTDLDLSDDLGRARKLAYFDNRTSEIGLAWSAEQIVADLDTGVDLEGMFREDELAELLGKQVASYEDYFAKFDQESADLDGEEEITIGVVVPARCVVDVRKWLANGNKEAVHGMRKVVLERY